MTIFKTGHSNGYKIIKTENPQKHTKRKKNVSEYSKVHAKPRVMEKSSITYSGVVSFPQMTQSLRGPPFPLEVRNYKKHNF